MRLKERPFFLFLSKKKKDLNHRNLGRENRGPKRKKEGKGKGRDRWTEEELCLQFRKPKR